MVTVIYSYWNEWGALHDKQLLPAKKWNAVCAGGNPQNKKATYFFSRLIYKATVYFQQRTKRLNKFADFAIARNSYFLIKEAKKHRADLYIGHNLGALPATVKAAKRHKKPCGFDAEDFHRQEVSDDTGSFHFKICKYIEDKYLPQVNYLSAASPLIAQQYKSLYNRPVLSILNVFPKTNLPIINSNQHEPLKLFWFSQTTGSNRGLETIINALSLSEGKFELHLLGQPVENYKIHLIELLNTSVAKNCLVYFYKPIKAEGIFHFAAQFDIGLAAETDVCLNRDIALTNKIFTYMQSGLAIAASSTSAQKDLMQQYPETGKLYGGETELAAILTGYYKDRKALAQAKASSYNAGQKELNWEQESVKFIKLVTQTLAQGEI